MTDQNPALTVPQLLARLAALETANVAKIADLENRNAALQTENTDLKARNQGLEVANAGLLTRNDALETDNAGQGVRIANLEAQVTDVGGRNVQLVAQRVHATTRANVQENLINALKAEMKELRAQKGLASNRGSNLKNANDGYKVALPAVRGAMRGTMGVIESAMGQVGLCAAYNSFRFAQTRSGEPLSDDLQDQNERIWGSAWRQLETKFLEVYPNYQERGWRTYGPPRRRKAGKDALKDVLVHYVPEFSPAFSDMCATASRRIEEDVSKYMELHFKRPPTEFELDAVLLQGKDVVRKKAKYPTSRAKVGGKNPPSPP